MPIRFRCGYCNRLLGIARRKAGQEIACPYCAYTITVPEEQPEEQAAEQSEPIDLDDLLNTVGSADATPVPAAATHAPGPVSSNYAPPMPVRPQQPITTHFPSRPATPAAEAAPSTNRAPEAPQPGAVPTLPAAATSATASHLPANGSHIVLSTTRATVLLIAAILMIGLSFAAGFLVATLK